MKICGMLWDIDGTLIDSEPAHLRALLATCQAFDVDISDLAPDYFTGTCLDDVWEELKSHFPRDIGKKHWVQSINAHYAAHADQLTPRDDATQVMIKIAQKGIRQAAVSNSNREIVDINLQVLGVSNILEFSLSIDDVTSGKPNPEPYLSALNGLGLDAAQAYAVEDSKAGVESAMSANIRVFGYGNPMLPADFHIDNLNQIFEHLED